RSVEWHLLRQYETRWGNFHVSGPPPCVLRSRGDARYGAGRGGKGSVAPCPVRPRCIHAELPPGESPGAWGRFRATLPLPLGATAVRPGSLATPGARRVGMDVPELSETVRLGRLICRQGIAPPGPRSAW